MSVEDNIASVLELTNTTPEYQKEKLGKPDRRVPSAEGAQESG